ncbi:MBL fold metallo-hydrolase [Pannus brasiliensis CCIBt3594]|uniref:MBL fold metallo-hydrolase n=1 Tax=Pannus brasiliensis CCIBt3594 TaxID=1427578 RepID=A0AAW9QP57_9CHRO
MRLTWLDSNSWLLELGGKRLLVDPWLVGSLTFGNLTWLFEGTKTKTRPIPENIDAIVLSQGLEDHAHPPTLKALDRSLPVIASPNAAKVVRELGYQTIVTLSHGEKYTLDSSVAIEAVPGSPVGPTAIENGYILEDLATGHRLYYEPHGYHSPELKTKGSIDVILTPIIDLKLPLLGPVIKGQKSALEVCELLHPRVIIPTAAGGDIRFEGLLMSVLRAEGSVETFRDLLKSKSLDTRAIDPIPWEPFTVEFA